MQIIAIILYMTLYSKTTDGIIWIEKFMKIKVSR